MTVVAEFIYAHIQKKPFSASSLAVNLMESYIVMWCRLERLAAEVSVRQREIYKNEQKALTII